MSAEQAVASTEAVLTERRGNVLLITINRPEVRNAVNGAVAEGIANALEQLDADGQLSVGVLTGAGTRADLEQAGAPLILDTIAGILPYIDSSLA